MSCRYEEVINKEAYRDMRYKCNKYGFYSGLRCTKLNQPICYREVRK